MKSLTQKGFSLSLKRYIGVNNAPFENSGYIYLNKKNKIVTKVAVSLDLSVDSAKIAIKERADILLCFHSPDQLDDNEKVQKKILEFAQNRLSIYKSHLPLNFSKGGLHQKLCDILGFRAKPMKFIYRGEILHGGFYRIIGEFTMNEILSKLKKLNGPYVRVYNEGHKNHKYRNIVLSSGSGFKKEIMDQFPCGMIISGEIKHGAVVKARDLGITLVEIGHYVSENGPLSIIADELKRHMGVEVLFVDVPFQERFYEFK